MRITLTATLQWEQEGDWGQLYDNPWWDLVYYNDAEPSRSEAPAEDDYTPEVIDTVVRPTWVCPFCGKLNKMCWVSRGSCSHCSQVNRFFPSRDMTLITEKKDDELIYPPTYISANEARDSFRQQPMWEAIRKVPPIWTESKSAWSNAMKTYRYTRILPDTTTPLNLVFIFLGNRRKLEKHADELFASFQEPLPGIPYFNGTEKHPSELIL